MAGLAETIKEIRKQRLRFKIPQADCAKALGISQSTWAKYETGKREPDFLTVKRMGRAVGLLISIQIERVV